MKIHLHHHLRTLRVTLSMSSALAMLFACFLAPSGLWGESKNYIGTDGGDTGVILLDSNWSPSGIPDASDNVTIGSSSAGRYAVTLSDDWTVSNLGYFGNNRAFTIVAGKALTVIGTLTTTHTSNTATFAGGSVSAGNLSMGDGGSKIAYFNTENLVVSGTTALTGVNALNLNVTGTASLGKVSIAGTNHGTLTPYITLADIDWGASGAQRTISTSGIESGTVAQPKYGEIYFTNRLNSGRSRSVTLNIDTAAGTYSTFRGTLKDSRLENLGLLTVKLVKAGEGVQEFTNANSYSGTTEITGGTLLANNASGSATGTSAVVVKTTGTLGGSGFVGGAVSTESNGRLSPGVLTEAGENLAGVLTINNTLTLGDQSILNYNLSTANVAGGEGGNDFIQVNGSLTLGSSVTLSAIVSGGVLADGKYTLFGYTGLLNGAENLSTWSVNGLTLAADQRAVFGYDADTVFFQLTTGAIPEPATWALIVGIALLGYTAVRRIHRI